MCILDKGFYPVFSLWILCTSLLQSYCIQPARSFIFISGQTYLRALSVKNQRFSSLVLIASLGEMGSSLPRQLGCYMPQVDHGVGEVEEELPVKRRQSQCPTALVLSWDGIPGSAAAGHGHWSPVAPAPTVCGSALSAPGPPSSPLAPPAGGHSCAPRWPAAPWGPHCFSGHRLGAAGNPSRETRYEGRASGWALGPQVCQTDGAHLKLALDRAQVFLGLCHLTVGMTQLNLHLIEIALHLLLQPQGVIAAADFCI